MEDSELKLTSIAKFFTHKDNNKVKMEKGRVIVTHNNSNLSKILGKYGIFIPTNLDAVINEEIRKELKL